MRLEGKLDTHLLTYTSDRINAVEEMGKRPTRTEVISWLVGAGTASGIIFGVINTFS